MLPRSNIDRLLPERNRRLLPGSRIDRDQDRWGMLAQGRTIIGRHLLPPERSSSIDLLHGSTLWLLLLPRPIDRLLPRRIDRLRLPWSRRSRWLLPRLPRSRTGLLLPRSRSQWLPGRMRSRCLQQPRRSRTARPRRRRVDRRLLLLLAPSCRGRLLLAPSRRARLLLTPSRRARLLHRTTTKLLSMRATNSRSSIDLIPSRQRQRRYQTKLRRSCRRRPR